MTETKADNQINCDDSKYEDENFMKKLAILAEKVGITVEEAKERKLSKNQLKKMIRNEVSLSSSQNTVVHLPKSIFIDIHH